MSSPSRRIASYEAEPDEVSRVLLLYSGGLDTSVMLKWIQDQYGAEIVALTVDLGQPGEDFEIVRDKALRLGALDCLVVDAKEEFARDYVLPAIKANALYGGGYPLFTALGRPLIAKIAVEKAREAGCDGIAHGCTGKGNDQVRLDSAVLAYAPDMKIVAPVRNWAMGREEEIAYAREHGIPVKGGTEAPPYSISSSRPICQPRTGAMIFSSGSSAMTVDSIRTWSFPLPVQPCATVSQPLLRAYSTASLAISGRPSAVNSG